MGVIEYVEQTRRVNKDIMLDGFTARQAMTTKLVPTLTPRTFFFCRPWSGPLAMLAKLALLSLLALLAMQAFDLYRAALLVKDNCFNPCAFNLLSCLKRHLSPPACIKFRVRVKLCKLPIITTDKNNRLFFTLQLCN